VASAQNVGASNLGNAAGAFLSGATLDRGLGLRAPPIAAALAALLGLATAICGFVFDRRQARI
jgi:DHA1 family inner membrane transport protein